MPAQHAFVANEVFRAIADPTRRAILDLLRAGAQSAGKIADSFSISRPGISKHLRLLKSAQLVTESRTGRKHVYQLNAKLLSQIDEWLSPYRRFWQQSQERKRKP